MGNISKNNTIDYYNNNAKSYFENTLKANMDFLYKKFLNYLPDKKKITILDVGSGSGRDSLYFLQKGYSVVALEPSEELVKMSRKIIGDIIVIKYIEDISYSNIFDGVWACASLLHIPHKLMNNILKKLYQSLKDDGILFISLKKGDFEGVRNKRYFCDYTLDKFNKLSYKKIGFKLVEHFETFDVRKDRNNELWLNLILKK